MMSTTLPSHTFSTTDLGSLLVTVVAEGNSTAGETLSLICIMEAVEGVSPENISITWTGPDRSIPTGEDIGIEIYSTTGNVTTGRLVFSPLRTSDRGQYTCIGRISNVGANVSGNDSMKINVTSKQSFSSVVHYTLWYVHILSSSTKCVNNLFQY